MSTGEPQDRLPRPARSESSGISAWKGSRAESGPAVLSGPVAGPDAHGPAVEVEDLVKVYPGGKTALGGISFTVGRGEIFGFLGPNGSSKTTTVKILVTLLARTSGSARVCGFDTAGQPSRIRQVIGYTGQFIGIDDDLTVLENLAISGMRGRPSSSPPSTWRRQTGPATAWPSSTPDVWSGPEPRPRSRMRSARAASC